MCTDVTSANGAEPQLRSSRNEPDPKLVAIQVQQHWLAYSASVRDEVEDTLAEIRAQGGRVTPARRAVLEAILNAGEHHFTAAEIFDAVESTDRRPDRATVYLTLDLLTELGVVTPLQLDSDAVVYHRTDHRHGHLVCDRCGGIVELPRTAVSALARKVLHDRGFFVDTDRVTITGLCERCASGTDRHPRRPSAP
jgi:Fe2+ or Zn2+ uptake regulation protein